MGLLLAIAIASISYDKAHTTKSYALIYFISAIDSYFAWALSAVFAIVGAIHRLPALLADSFMSKADNRADSLSMIIEY